MASGLEALVGAATEGMRKTQSAEEMMKAETLDVLPSVTENGHMSDSAAAPTRERKKGVPWTEDEHRLFLLGLQKLGKGDWRGISRHFVQSRTPTQVASHAQKYFIRQNNMNKRKRRSSLFDIVNEAPLEGDQQKAHRVHGVQPLAGPSMPANINIGGLSIAFATHLGGHNPTGMAPPAEFSSHGARPPLGGLLTPGSVHSATSASHSGRDATHATTSGIGIAGEAAAATIAALSMASSPAAAGGGYLSSAHAFPGLGPRSAPDPRANSASELETHANVSQTQATQVQVNGFAAMMAQMGAMGAMGQMGSFPPPTNWMATYHAFLSQMSAAQVAAQRRPPGSSPFAHMHGQPMAPTGAQVTFPPTMMGGPLVTPISQNFETAPRMFPRVASEGALFRPTAARAAPVASPTPGSGEEKAAMVTA